MPLFSTQTSIIKILSTCLNNISYRSKHTAIFINDSATIRDRTPTTLTNN